MPRRFAYYDRLSAEEKATYRKSDAIGAIPLPHAGELAPIVALLEKALASGSRARTANATKALVTGILVCLDLPPLRVHVREVRPQITGGELHGLYTFGDDERGARLEVWMRTAAKAKVVRFRTFLRTLVHEVCHHLDVTHLRLDDSFHTEGFFRRESSLVRQLLPQGPKPEKKKEKSAADLAKARQMGLF